MRHKFINFVTSPIIDNAIFDFAKITTRFMRMLTLKFTRKTSVPYDKRATYDNYLSWCGDTISAVATYDNYGAGGYIR